MSDRDKKIEALRLAVEYFKMSPQVGANDIVKMAEAFYNYLKK